MRNIKMNDVNFWSKYVYYMIDHRNTLNLLMANGYTNTINVSRLLLLYANSHDILQIEINVRWHAIPISKKSTRSGKNLPGFRGRRKSDCLSADAYNNNYN